MKKGKQRNYSLDVLRGLAIATMLLLDGPPDDIYAILKHAAWEGLTIPDVALPLFAFSMGAGAALSTREPTTRRILKRAIILFALGFFITFGWNVLLLIHEDAFTLGNFFDTAIAHGRLFGVLQRLAVTYALALFLVREIKSTVGIFIAAFVLLILSTAGFYIYAPENPFDEAHNISRAVDFIFPGENHIYTPTHDPEGLYGSIAGTASVLFGYLAGKVLIDKVATTREKILLLSAAGVLLMIAGGLWTSLDIVSKKLWTSSYALINAGGDALLLALIMKVYAALPDEKKFLRPFKALGTNPLFFFMANCLMLSVLNFMPSPDDGTGLYLWLYQHTTQGIISPEFGTLLFCVLWMMLWLPVAEIFYRRGITIKI